MSSRLVEDMFKMLKEKGGWKRKDFYQSPSSYTDYIRAAAPSHITEEERIKIRREIQKTKRKKEKEKQMKEKELNNAK